jgi:CxxC-x17-CxxC domain-containing protein
MPSKKITPNPTPSPKERPQNGNPGSVMVQKRKAEAEPTLREKLCAGCGKPFHLEAEQKFYLCPDCYRKAQPAPKKSVRKGEAQVLIQIRCADCGVVEYLDFVPSDPNATYCRACFSKRKRELKGPAQHA